MRVSSRIVSTSVQVTSARTRAQFFARSRFAAVPATNCGAAPFLKKKPRSTSRPPWWDVWRFRRPPSSSLMSPMTMGWASGKSSCTLPTAASIASIVSDVPKISARSAISQYGLAESATGLMSIALPGAPMDSDPRVVTSSSTRRASSSSLRLSRAAGASRDDRSRG